MRNAASHCHDPLPRIPRLPPLPQPPFHVFLLHHLWRHHLRNHCHHVPLRQSVGPVADRFQGCHPLATCCFLRRAITRKSYILYTMEEAGKVRTGGQRPRSWREERDEPHDTDKNDARRGKERNSDNVGRGHITRTKGTVDRACSRGVLVMLQGCDTYQQVGITSRDL